MARVLTAILCTALFFGCASIKENQRASAFEKTADRYERLVRFNEFEKAATFLGPTAGTNAAADPVYRTIKVSRYDVVSSHADPTALTARQSVDIGYYEIDRLVEKVYRDEQRWRYDEQLETWILETGLPAFPGP